jgi:hypothetical protein
VCFSQKTVDSCGVCGGIGGCNIPLGSYPCGTLNILGKCEDLICGSLNFNQTTSSLIIPVQPNVLVNFMGVKPPQEFILKLEKKKISGYYSSDLKYSVITLVMDSGIVGGQVIRATLSYDFTGDGVFDRIEEYDGMPPNDLVNFEAFRRVGTPVGTPNSINLLPPEPAPFQRMINGTVRLEIWVGLSKAGPVYLMTDNNPNGASTSVQIPYITASGYNENTNCGPINVPTGITGTATDPSSTSTGGVNNNQNKPLPSRAAPNNQGFSIYTYIMLFILCFF